MIVYFKFDSINQQITNNRKKVTQIKNVEQSKSEEVKDVQVSKAIDKNKNMSSYIKVYSGYNLEIYTKGNQKIYSEYKDIFDKQLTGKYMMYSGKIIIESTSLENGKLIAKFDLVTTEKTQKNLVWNSGTSSHYIMGNQKAPSPNRYPEIEGTLTDNGIVIPNKTKYFYITIDGTIYKDYLVDGEIKSNYKINPTREAEFNSYSNKYIPFDTKKDVLFDANVSNIIGNNINTTKGWINANQNGIKTDLKAKEIKDTQNNGILKAFVSLRQYPSEYSEIIYQSFKKKDIQTLNSMKCVGNIDYYYIDVDGVYGWVTSNDLELN